MSDSMPHDDFEKRLKKEAEDFLPQPSSRVWENIHNELHPRRRKYLLATAAAVLLLLGVGVYFLQKQYVSSNLKSSVAEQIPAGTLPAQTPPPPSDNSQSRKQPAQPVASSGKIFTQPQKSGETESVGLTTKPRIGHTEDSQRNNRTASSKSAIARKNDLQNPELFAPNKEKEQMSGPKLGNQSGKISGLPLLENLSLFLSTPHSRNYVELSTFALADRISSSWMIPQNEGNLSFSKKENKKVSPGKLYRKPSYEIFYTPGMGYRSLTEGSSGMMTGNTSSSYSSSSLSNLKQQPAWSWAAGARVILPFGKSWSLQTGLSVEQSNYSITAYGTYPAYVQNNNNYYYSASPSRSLYFLSTNALAAARPAVNHLHNSYFSGEIPLLVGKHFGNPRSVSLNLAAGAGLTYLFHTNPVIYSPVSGRYFTGADYIRKFNGNFHIETSLFIPLGPTLKLDVGPSFQYQILSSYKNYPAIKERPYLLGFKTGLQWGR